MLIAVPVPVHLRLRHSTAAAARAALPASDSATCTATVRAATASSPTRSLARTAPDRAGERLRLCLSTLSDVAVATISLGRRFPYADSCWLELWGTRGYERVPFMWDADVWSDGSDEVFVGAMRAQAEAFARAVRGGPCEGADGDDAVAALTVAVQVAESLAGRAARAAAAVE